MSFNLVSPFKPTGDQPQAIKQLVDGIEQGEKAQVLLGVTGSGKTYTMAKVIEAIQLPTLVISHNKTLSAQLYREFCDFFPRFFHSNSCFAPKTMYAGSISIYFFVIR